MAVAVAGAGLGGVCLYGSNRDADVAAVAAGLHAVRADVVVALDEEGGDVARLGRPWDRRSPATPPLVRSTTRT